MTLVALRAVGEMLGVAGSQLDPILDKAEAELLAGNRPVVSPPP